MSSIQQHQQQQRQQPQQQRRLTKRCSCDLLGMTEPLVSRPSPAPATLVTTATTATTVVTATANNATGTAQVSIVKYFQ